MSRSILLLIGEAEGILSKENINKLTSWKPRLRSCETRGAKRLTLCARNFLSGNTPFVRANEKIFTEIKEQSHFISTFRMTL